MGIRLMSCAVAHRCATNKLAHPADGTRCRITLRKFNVTCRWILHICLIYSMLGSIQEFGVRQNKVINEN